MKKNRLICACLAAAMSLGLSLPAHAAQDGPAVSRNKNLQDYATWSKPVTSYLYENGIGGLTRVEYIDGAVVVEDYDGGFQFRAGRSLSAELPIWGGFFAGVDYNFLIFGQENKEEDNSKEVIRVVKYSKDWERLGQASLRGANTTVPFDAGSLRCDEYGGYLYIRTCHEMYTTEDGLNHQANLTMAVRQSDMSITDSYYDIMNVQYGYVSHSFNQFLIVDEDGLIVTLDHGDAHPRAAVFMRYYANAATGKFTGDRYGTWCSNGNMMEFAGQVGDNTTGASVGGLAETSGCYVMAYNYDGAGGRGDREVYYHYMDKPSGRSWSVQITKDSGSGSTTPVLAPTGLDGGYMLWNEKSGYTVSDALHYITYGADGTPGEIQTAQGSLSDCQPIPYQGGVVWYVTDNSAPVFYTLKDGKLTTSAPSSTPEEPDPVQTPVPTANPSDFIIQDGVLTEYVRPGGKVVIPEGVQKIDGPETLKGFHGAFQYRDDITEIVIPSSVTEITGAAFRGCSGLTGVTIPGNVKTLGIMAFEGCDHLTQVIMEEGVESLGNGLFESCSQLSDIRIPSTVKEIAHNAFTGTPWLDEQTGFIIVNGIMLKYKGDVGTDMVIPGEAKCINDYSFTKRLNMKNLILSDGVETIRGMAFFANDNLESITIPPSVTSISRGAFAPELGRFHAVIHGQAGSAAESFAKEIGATFIADYVPGGTPAPSGNRFSDVKPTDWYYDTVMDMVDKGAVNGFPDGTFGPEKPITMVELCKIAQELLPPMKTSLDIYGAETVETVGQMLAEQNPGYWANGVISDSLMAYGFADDDIDFDGQLSVWAAPIDRAFLTRLIYQIYEKSAANAGAQLKIDADVYPAIGDYVTGGVAESDYLPHILWAYGSGLVGGINANGDFNPGGQVSRAEACTILSRLLDPTKRLTIEWTPIEAVINAPLSAPGTGTDSFGNSRLRYAEDVAYEYARALEERTGMKISYLPEYTQKSSSLFQYSDMAPFIDSPIYFQRVLLELHFLKESLDQYPDGLIREVVANKGGHATEIVLFPYPVNNMTQYGLYIYDESTDPQKVDQIFYTGYGDVHFYTHEMGHMVMSAAAIKKGYSNTVSRWEELYSASFADNGFVTSYASQSRAEDWAETWAYLWLDPYAVARQANAGAGTLAKKAALLTELLGQYQSVNENALPWSSLFSGL